jgi:hypothetical protein
MAIQVNGTTVIDNSRALSNIASIDATTVAALGAAGVGGADKVTETFLALNTKKQLTTNTLISVPAAKHTINNTTGYDLIEVSTGLDYITADPPYLARRASSVSSTGTTWNSGVGAENLRPTSDNIGVEGPGQGVSLPGGDYSTGGSSYNSGYQFTVTNTFSQAFVAAGAVYKELYSFNYEMQVLDGGTYKTIIPNGNHPANQVTLATQNLGISSNTYRFNLTLQNNNAQLAFYIMAPVQVAANPSGRELTFTDPVQLDSAPSTLTAYIVVDGSGSWGVSGSRNGGTNYTAGTLVSTTNLGKSLKALEYSINVSSQPSAADIDLKISVPTTGAYYGAGIYYS